MTQTSDRHPEPQGNREPQESRTPHRQNARLTYATRMTAGLAMMGAGAALFLRSLIRWLLCVFGRGASCAPRSRN